MVDFQKAKLDPARVFDSPADVLAAGNLDPAQKRAVLESWKYDCLQQEVAESEAGMEQTGKDLLDEVIAALHELEDEDGAG